MKVREWRWTAIFAAVIMLLTCLPYLFGWAICPEDYYYSGFLTNPDEHNVYLSYMRQAHDGHLFFSDLFTSEPQPGRVINVYFLALGLFARLTHLSLPIVYHLARLISGWLLLMAIYWLASQVLTTLTGRRLALALTATASGFGWLFEPKFGQMHPIDYGDGLVMPEAITFLTLLLNPLFAFSMFLMILIYGFATHAFTSGSFRSAIFAGLAALILGNIHSYDLFPVGIILATFWIVSLLTRRIRLRAILHAIIIAVIAAPAFIYQLWLRSIGDMTIIVKLVGPPALAPSWIWIALGLGIPLLLALVGIIRTSGKSASDISRLLAIWTVLGFAVIFAPVPFQRKLAEGLHIPICLLAVSSLESLWQADLRKATTIGAVLLLLCAPSNALYLRHALKNVATNNANYLLNLLPPVYLRSDQYGALNWLNRNANKNEMLLCNNFLASYTPSLTGMHVYFGHWSETLHYGDKVREYTYFLSASTPDERREAFCRGRNIVYVLRDRSNYDDVYIPPEERKGGGFDPDKSAWLERVYQQDAVSLYRVRAH